MLTQAQIDRGECEHGRLKRKCADCDLIEAERRIGQLEAEVGCAYSFIYNITPNRTEDDLKDTLDEQIQVLKQKQEAEVVRLKSQAVQGGKFPLGIKPAPIHPNRAK